MGAPFSLPPELQDKVQQEADACGLSLSEFICKSLEWTLKQKPSADPLFADTAVFEDDTPSDLAKHHDEYLYGDAS